MSATQILENCNNGIYNYTIERSTKNFIFYNVDTGRTEKGEIIRVHKSQTI